VNANGRTELEDRFCGPLPGANDDGGVNIVGHLIDDKIQWLPGKEPRRRRLPPPPEGFVATYEDE
jgi:hypothetical protein